MSWISREIEKKKRHTILKLAHRKFYLTIFNEFYFYIESDQIKIKMIILQIFPIHYHLYFYSYNKIKFTPRSIRSFDTSHD